MGINAGFDMVPSLSKGMVDKRNWQDFIDAIKKQYKDDEAVEVKPNYIVFKEGEHPTLPFEGHKLLRFSAKISGSHAGRVQTYLDEVTLLAKIRFGSRVQVWDEGTEVWGHYDWAMVNDSFKSYEQPDEQEIPTSIAQLVLGTDPIGELGIALFETQDVPGKGKGMVARFNIANGKRIISEKPLFTTRNISPISLMESTVVAKLKALSKEEQRKFLSLHNNFPGKSPFSGIVKTNALPCGPGSIIGGVYSTISLINHSCLPNAHNNWNSDTNIETIHATRYIPAGEEVTICYSQNDPYIARHQHLQESFGFNCDCALCVLPLDNREASDNRRGQIQHLDAAIGDPMRVRMSPNKSLADCHAMLQVLDEEFKGSAAPLVARTYYDAFQISIANGDQARASVFAEKAYKARVVCEGEDSPATRKMKIYVGNPTNHASFGGSRRWKTVKGSTPKGLDVEEFEKWLWRRAE